MKILIRILEFIALVGRIASFAGPLIIVIHNLIVIIFILLGQSHSQLEIALVFLFLGLIWLGFTLFGQSAFICFLNTGGFSSRTPAALSGILAGLLLMLMIVNFSGWINLIQSLDLALFLGLIATAVLFWKEVPKRIMGSFVKLKS